MARRFIPIKANIGKSRLSSSTRTSQAEYTKMTRDSMAAVIKNFEAWVAHMNKVTPEVLIEALQPSFDESQVLVPKDTGELMRSGYLEIRKFRGKALAEIGYGRGGFPHYAVYVHENLEMAHRPPEQAKFLQQPLEEHSDQIRETIMRGLKESSGV